MKLLVLSPHAWNSEFRLGCHHLTEELSQDYDCTYISAPLSPLHFFAPRSTRLWERLKLIRETKVNEKIRTFVPISAIAPHFRFPLDQDWVAENWTRFSNLEWKQKLYQTNWDLVYIEEPYFWPFIQDLRVKKSFLRIGDHLPSFRGHTPARQKLLEDCAGKVDLVCYSSRDLNRIVERLSPRKKLYLPNAVKLSNFKRPHECPVEFKECSKPIVVYIGALDFWFDHELVNQLVRSLPELEFFFIGSAGRETKKRFSFLRNLKLLGPRPYSQIPAYLQHAQVGVIPFNQKSFPQLVDHIHPLKLYEYMACDLPTVATPWEELKQMQAPIKFGTDAEEFKAQILDCLNSDSEAGKRKSYAEQNDWSTRAKLIEEHL